MKSVMLMPLLLMFLIFREGENKLWPESETTLHKPLVSTVKYHFDIKSFSLSSSEYFKNYLLIKINFLFTFSTSHSTDSRNLSIKFSSEY